MAKREYIEKNRQWLADKAQEAGVNPPAQRHLLQSHLLGRQRRTQAVGTQRCHRTLHRTHNQRAHIRQQPRGFSACSTAQRPHHRMEHRDATDARRRPMGSVYPGGDGLRQTVAARHSRRLHTNLRHRVAQRILTAAVSGKRRQI